MAIKNNLHTVRLFDLLAIDGGEQFFESIANSFLFKMLTLKQSSLSKTECKAISRFGYFDEDSQSYKLPAVLIAQFSRNFNENSESISGADLMDIALDRIKDILHSTSGKAVFLECEQSKKIIDFYTKNNFQPLGNTIFSKNKKDLTQLYMIL